MNQKLDKLIEKQIDKLANDMFEDEENPNRPLFSEETAKKSNESYKRRSS